MFRVRGILAAITRTKIRMRDNGSVTKKRMSIGVVWLAALIGVIGVGVLAAPARHVTWVSILMLVLICMTCLVQLSLQEADGFVRRMSVSLVGALVILAAGSVVLAFLGGGALVGVSAAGQ